MSFPGKIRSALSNRVPGGLRRILPLAVVALVAFALGGLILGDGGSTDLEQVSQGTDVKDAAPEVWTCSMHPQIKLPKPGKCPICHMDLIPLKSGGEEDLGPRQLRMSETAKQLAKIQTTPAVRALASTEVRMVGSIQYDETRVAYITAWVPGRLDRLYADYTGVTVEKGDHLVYIYSPELLAAQEELIQALQALSALSKTNSDALLSTARATLDAAREKLRLFGLTASQVEEIERSRKATDHLTIYSPIGGVVVHKNALEGMYVETGTRIYTIAELSKLWVMFEAYESDLPWLRYGQLVQFTSPSFPGERFEATISFIDPLVDPKTRTVRVRAVVDNSKGRLKPDMFVRGVVKSRIDRHGRIVDERLAGNWICPMHPEVVKNGPGNCDVCGMDLVPASSLGYANGSGESGEKPLLIPASAPLITGTRAVVYVEIPSSEGPLFEGREVELGPRAGDYYVVKSGVEEGELVVSNGAFKIDSELQIHAKPSMMSPAGGEAEPDRQHGQPVAKTTTTHQTPSAAPKTVDSSDAMREALAPVYEAYFKIWEALAKDDLGKTRRSGESFRAAVKDVDMGLFTGPAHGRWMASKKSLIGPADRIAQAKDIAAARSAFYDLSKATIELHGDFGHAGDSSFYLSFCPMARDGEGAYWLQDNDDLLNPYFGSSMLYCGSVRETYKASSGEKR